jgi:hypothetical protein
VQTPATAELDNIMLLAFPEVDADVEIGKTFQSQFDKHARVIECGVAAVGEPAAYALVWEWGNVRQSEKGPRTVLGVNPDGENVWLSIQAPKGWIAINEPAMWDALDAEVDKIEFTGEDEFHISEQIEKAAIRIAKVIKNLLQDTVPIETAALHDSLQVIEPGDSLLDKFGEDNDTGIFMISGE